MLKKIRNIFNYNFSLHFRFLFNVNAKRIRFLGPFEFNVDKNSIISSTNNSACFIGSPIGATGRKSLITQIKLKKNSKLILGENSIIGSGCTVSCNSNAIISIGKNSYIASTSILSQMIIKNGGLKIKDALKIKPQDIVKELDGLPQIKIHCSVLGDQALKKAVENYYQSKKQHKNRIRSK